MELGPVTAAWKASPPSFKGKPVTLLEVGKFATSLLLSDPFGTGDQVPWVDLRAQGSASQVVALTQQQLAFIIANALMGNSIPAMGDGLSAALERCSSRSPQRSYVYSLLSVLAVLSQELASPGDQGSLLVGLTPRKADASWHARLTNGSLQAPTVCVQIGSNASQCGLADFMAGGTPLQALTDIAGNDVGGGAQLCDVANSQDESLVQFYGEVLAFSFFVGGGAMLPVPFTLLGARRYLSNIGGETSLGPPYFSSCGRIPTQNWLNEDISANTVSVLLQGSQVSEPIAASSFVAVASVCTACNGKSGCSNNDVVNNNCDYQRRHLDDDVTRWIQVYDVTMYAQQAQVAFKAVVQRAGTGPWGAGLWFGDSQQYFLAVWLASSLISGLSLDYYVYDLFCENGGNQCFVLGQSGCAACLASAKRSSLQASRCGRNGLQEVINRFRGRPPQDLYNALLHVGGPPAQVFDLVSDGDLLLF